MTNQPVLRARSTTTTAVVPASEADAQLDVQLRLAATLSKGGYAVPKSYRGNVAACWLVLEWARHRDMDPTTAMQGVSFVDGRPVIDATMQRALAINAGYSVSIPEVSAEAVTVQIVGKAGETLGSATYTIGDADRAGLTEKPNWQNNPEDMLVARATTRAMRRFAPDVMVGLVAGEDELDEIKANEDPIGTLVKNAGEDQDPQAVVVTGNPAGETEEPPAAPNGVAPESSPATPDDEPEDAELVDEPISDVTRGRVLTAISAAKEAGTWKDRALALQAAGIEPVPKRMTEAEGVAAIEILESETVTTREG